MATRTTAIFAAVIALVQAAPAYGQTSQAATPAPAGASAAVTTAAAVRAARAPTIDGRDLDAVWLGATKYDQFRQFEPKIDADPSFRTEFRSRSTTRISTSSCACSIRTRTASCTRCRAATCAVRRTRSSS